MDRLEVISVLGKLDKKQINATVNSAKTEGKSIQVLGPTNAVKYKLNPLTDILPPE